MANKSFPVMEYPKTATGIEGLDTMLKGGFPKGRIVLTRGAPGVGKTILCAQFLYKGAAKYKEKGIFVSLEETKQQLIREMFLVGMDFRGLEESKMVTFIDASPIRHIPAEVKLGNISVGKRDFSLVALAKKIKDTAQEREAVRIVIDPLTAFSLQYPDDSQRRMMVLDLIEALAQTGATCLMTEELRTTQTERDIPVEDYSVHGVVLMRPLRVGKSITKTIQIVKMRETKHDDQNRIYKITDEGIVVYPDENVLALL